MKITIEPTSDDKNYNTISVQNRNDDLNITEAVELIEAALIAWGFNSDLVRDYYKETTN